MAAVLAGADIAPWFWIAAGIVACALEALAPGVFLLWIGLAAVLTGLVSLVVALSGIAALVVFGVLAVICALIGRKVYGARDIVSDRPNLNRPADALVGSTLILSTPIENGEGQARVNDSVWRVRGPDLPNGARVRVIGVDNGVRLRVEAA